MPTESGSPDEPDQAPGTTEPPTGEPPTDEELAAWDPMPEELRWNDLARECGPSATDAMEGPAPTG